MKITGKKRQKIDMDNNNNPTDASGQGNNFLSGFLIGVLVGAAVVFLLATKKGRKLLKAISEEGIDNISNLLDEANKSGTSEKMLDKTEDSNGSYEETEDVAPKREFAVKEKAIEEKPKARRFFRGISRHVN